MQGMTDPASIRMVKEVIEFAYSRRATTSSRRVSGRTFDLCSSRERFLFNKLGASDARDRRAAVCCGAGP